MAAVRASALVKRFETTTAVDGVDLVVQEGQVRGLLGPNEIGLFGRRLGSAESVDLHGVGGFVERGEDRVSGYSTGMRAPAPGDRRRAAALTAAAAARRADQRA